MEENFTLAEVKAEPASPENAEPAEEETEDANSELGSDEASEDASNSEPEPEGETDQGEDEPAPTAHPSPEPTKSRPPSKPAKPSIMERYARAHGFKKDGEDRFYHADGTWIAKANGDVFPWEKRSSTGDLVCHYWPKDHCLDEEPLQLGSDLWGLIDKFPQQYALILADHEGNALEVSGAKLSAMLKSKELVLFPATYRLVVNHDQ
jgi:hypothetical protein